jgi:membrane-associated phospholipid phosphatase
VQRRHCLLFAWGAAVGGEIKTAVFGGVGGISETGAAGITDLADQAVVLPLAAATLVLFACARWWRGTVAWAGAVGGTFLLILLLKLRYFACNEMIPEELIRNPSGHTAAAAVVYGSLAITMARSLFGVRRGLIPGTIAIASLIAFVIGMSRLQLDKHSIAEVFVGGGIGVTGAVSFVRLGGPPVASLGRVRLLLVALLVVTVLHGVRVSFEAGVARASGDVAKVLTTIDLRVCGAPG